MTNEDKTVIEKGTEAVKEAAEVKDSMLGAKDKTDDLKKAAEDKKDEVGECSTS